jgi:hypothetical protein
LRIDHLNQLRLAELDLIREYLPPHGCLLEIGAGTGLQGMQLRRLGYQLEMVDLPSSNYAAERLCEITDYEGEFCVETASQSPEVFSRCGAGCDYYLGRPRSRHCQTLRAASTRRTRDRSYRIVALSTRLLAAHLQPRLAPTNRSRLPRYMSAAANIMAFSPKAPMSSQMATTFTVSPSTPLRTRTP